MPVDPTLYALVRENNRMLKELTERLVPKTETYCTVMDCVLPAGHRDPHCGKNGLEFTAQPQPDSSAASEKAYSKFMDGYREVARQKAEGVPMVGAPTEHRPISEPKHETEPENFRALRLEVRALESERRHARDAALEEAIKVLGNIAIQPLDEWVKAVNSIRALKSKPAPEPSKNPGEFGRGDVRPAHLQTLKPCTCYRNAHPHVHVAHEGLTADECSRAGKALAMASGVKHVVVEPGGAKIAPEPLHDFAWALQQMRAGKKVRRKNESGTINLHPNGFGFGFGGNDILLTSGDLLATDWEVVE